MYAPIALFVYNRLDETRQTVEALQKNTLAAESDLIIFSDGPKTMEVENEVNEVREYIKGIQGFKSKKIIISETNRGLAPALIAGITEILKQHESIIVMEDDLVTSPYFLSFLNQALEMYKDDEAVISANGYTYPVGAALPQSFFLKGADCQGWATWRRGWALFNPDGKYLYDQIMARGLAREFNYNNSYSYTRMLRYQSRGRISSWAIRWYASAFLKEKLTLYPGASLVNNIGYAYRGTNSTAWDAKRYTVAVSLDEIQLKKIPAVESVDARRIFGRYFSKTRKPILIKATEVLRRMYKRVESRLRSGK